MKHSVDGCLENRDIEHVFGHISTTKVLMSKRTTPSDSAHRIGVCTLSKDVLTVYKGVCGWRLIFKVGKEPSRLAEPHERAKMSRAEPKISHSCAERARGL